MGINTLETILEHHGTTVTQFEDIQRRPDFQAYLQEHLRIWNSSLSTADRVRILQLATVEQCIPEIFAIIHDKKEPAAARVEAFKSLQRGSAAPTGDAAAGERFSIIINLGADTKLTYDKPLGLPSRVMPTIDLEAIEDI